MYQSFTDMPIWQQALLIANDIFQLTISLPRNEDYGLTSQIRRAVSSIGANIAEGFGRESKKDKRIFYIYARGSANETIHHLLYGKQVGYFSEEDCKRLVSELEGVIHSINKIVKSLSIETY